MINENKITTAIIGGLAIILFVYANLSLQNISTERYKSLQNVRGIWNFPPLLLEAVAGEFKGILADYLTLEVGAQLGTQVIRDGDKVKIVEKTYDWNNTYKLLSASQSLDPSFLQTYQLAQGWLPWKPADMVDETQEFLQITADNRPWDWQPYRSMAFNYYYFKNDLKEAGLYFLKAAKVKDAPSFLGIVGSRLALKGGSADLALVIVESMLEGYSEDNPGYQDLLDRKKALTGVRVLQNAVAEYKNRYGSYPENLETLTSVGILESLPKNPYNTEYCLKESGQIFFDVLNCELQ